MKLTKSQLKKMILQEIKISIGAFLEEGELGNAGIDDPQGGRVEGEPANFGSGGDIAQISEEDDPALEIPAESIEIADLEAAALIVLQSVGGNEEDPKFVNLNRAIELLKRENPYPGNFTQMASPGWAIETK